MTIKSKLSFEDFKKFNNLQLKKPAFIVIFIFCVINFILCLIHILGIYKIYDDFSFSQLLNVIFIFCVFSFITYKYKKYLKQSYENNLMTQEEITYAFEDELVKMTGESFNASINWSKLHQIKEKKDFILIYQSNQIANIIPKQDFGNQLIEFKNLVKTKNVKHNF